MHVIRRKSRGMPEAKKIQIAKAGLASIVGSAGEYLVMGELLRRGVLAGLAPRNAPGFDVLASDGHRAVHLRVKTKLSGGDWQWNAQSGKWNAPVFRRRARNDYSVLVDLKHREVVSFFIVKTDKLEKWLQHSHRKWLHKRGTQGQKHAPDNKKRILHESSPHLKELWRNDWGVLRLKFPIE